MAARKRAPWPYRRLFPLLATIVMTAFGMAGTIWGPRFYGRTAWALPNDLWSTLIAAQRLAHLNLAGLYTWPTQLVSFPGTAVILVPAAVVIDLTGLSLAPPWAHGPYPAVWLFAGPYLRKLPARSLPMAKSSLAGAVSTKPLPMVASSRPTMARPVKNSGAPALFQSPVSQVMKPGRYSRFRPPPCRHMDGPQFRPRTESYLYWNFSHFSGAEILACRQ